MKNLRNLIVSTIILFLGVTTFAFARGSGPGYMDKWFLDSSDDKIKLHDDSKTVSITTLEATSIAIGGAIAGNLEVTGDILHDDTPDSDFIIKNFDEDKDINFWGNDGTVDTLIMALDVSEGQLSGMMKTVAGVFTPAVAGTDYTSPSSTESFTNKTFDANGTGNTISNLETADFATNIVDTDSTLTADSDTRIVSQKAVKKYVDDNDLLYVPRQPTADIVINDSGANYGIRIESDTSQNAFVIDSIGVGIGGSPLYSLDVFGSARFLKTADIQNIIQTTGSNNAAYLTLKSGDSTTSASYAYTQYISDKTSPQTWLTGMRGSDSYQIRDVEVGATRFSIDNTGKVGIGVTPSDSQLHIYRNASIGTFGALTLANATQKIVDSSNTLYLDGNAIISNGLLNFGTNVATSIYFGTNDITRMTLDDDGGLFMTGATGASKGAGTINATAVYDDGVLLSDYVFDSYYDRKVKNEDIEAGIDPDYSIDNIDEFIQSLEVDRKLPTMPSREDWRKNGKYSTGELINRLWEQLEIMALYTMEQEERIDNLEERIIKLEKLISE